MDKTLNILQFKRKTVQEKCISCAKLNFSKVRNNNARPECYNGRSCSRKRSYYKNYEFNKHYSRRYKRAIKGLLTGCNVCGKQEVLESHHIIPIAIGGHKTQENRLTLCKQCHQTISSYYTIIGLMNVTIEYEKRAKRL